MLTPEQINKQYNTSYSGNNYQQVKNNAGSSMVQTSQPVTNNCGQITQQQTCQPAYCYYPPVMPMCYPTTQSQQTQAVATVPQPNIQPAGQTQATQQSQNTYWPQAYYYPPVYSAMTPNNCGQIPATTAGVNIQIINPAVNAGGCTPPQTIPPTTPPIVNGGNSGNGGNGGQGAAGATGPNGSTGTTGTEVSTDQKKTTKRKIVQLTDNYIKGLENFLNSQDKANRITGAQEVFARLEEDDSRANDKALTALINKMLQDPAEEVRFIALTALDQRSVIGDQKTVEILTNMQNSQASFGQEARDASSILLKMSGQIVEKEFEVKDENKSKSKSKNTLYE